MTRFVVTFANGLTESFKGEDIRVEGTSTVFTRRVADEEMVVRVVPAKAVVRWRRVARH